MTFAQWLSKRLINDIKGIEKKTGGNITTVPVGDFRAVMILWYNEHISKNDAIKILTNLLNRHKVIV